MEMYTSVSGLLCHEIKCIDYSIQIFAVGSTGAILFEIPTSPKIGLDLQWRDVVFVLRRFRAMRCVQTSSSMARSDDSIPVSFVVCMMKKDSFGFFDPENCRHLG